MLPNALTRTIIPRAILFAGLALAVVLVSRNIFAVSAARQELAAAKRAYQRQIVASDRCAADLRKSGKYGELVDLVIDGRCPPKPSGNPTDSFIRDVQSSRANALEQAGIVAVLASLPWLASRWTRARGRPPVRT